MHYFRCTISDVQLPWVSDGVDFGCMFKEPTNGMVESTSNQVCIGIGRGGGAQLAKVAIQYYIILSSIVAEGGN